MTNLCFESIGETWSIVSGEFPFALWEQPQDGGTNTDAPHLQQKTRNFT